MAMGQLQELVRRLRRMAAPKASSGFTDAQLLQRWVSTRDEPAFEVLVWRHGPMVLNVCRRLLWRAEDVEDAFQATFMALIRQAGSIIKGEGVGSWLHRVAHRVAVKAQAGAAKRARREKPGIDLLTVPPDDILQWRDVGQLLDEEINRLPEKYRVPFVLCYLEGKTNEEAAQELGRPAGTITTWLARGRERLRRRLVSRGLALSAGVLTTLAAQNTGSAGVPVALVSGTVKAALAITAGRAAAAGAVSTHVLALTDSVLRGMFLAKLKVAAVAILLAGVLSAGVSLAAYATVPALLTDAKNTNPAKPLGDGANKSQVDESNPRTDDGIVVISQEAEKILPATPIRLVYKDTPLDQALADLADKTGCSLIFPEGKPAEADKKITLDTGPTSFWIALDQFCHEAGLTCTDTSDGISRPGDYRMLVREPAFSPKPRPGFSGPPGIIFLGNAETERPATFFAGALRIRGLRSRPGHLKPEGNPLFLLEVKAEPKVPAVKFLGLTIDNAVDDQDQKLTRQEIAASGRTLRSPVAAETLPIVRFTAGKKPSKVIKKLEGTIDLQVQKPAEILMSVDNILQAAGKSVKGLDGESLKVVEVGRDDDGTIKVRIEMTLQLLNGQALPRSGVGKLGGPAPGTGKDPRIQTQFFGLSLVDDKGEAFQIVKPDNFTQVVGNRLSSNFTLICKPLKNQGEAAKLIFAASRNVRIKIPIVLRNVPLAVKPNPGKGQT